MELMAVKNGETVPLYIHTVYRILREMRVLQQVLGSPFNYHDFKSQIMDSGLAPTQLGPLQQRLDTLESFMPDRVAPSIKKGKKKEMPMTSLPHESHWGSKVGAIITSLLPVSNFPAWSSDDCRLVLPVRHPRERMFAIQHMSKLVRGAK